MADKEVIEVIHGKYHKYEVIRIKERMLSLKAYSFVIHRDGKYFKGSFSSLSDAVEAARKAG